MKGMKMSLEKLKYNYAQYKLKIPNKFSCSSQNQRNSMDFQNIALIKINYSKASRYTASSCPDLAGARF